MKKIIKFEKADCNPCVMVSQYLDSKSTAFEVINPFNNPEVAVKYKIRSVPTTLLIENDKVLMRSIGYQPEELNQIIEALQ
ncbi:thioredoxin domain-containing protein [Dysgonomonas sp.]|jgi:thioredoxin 1